MPTCALEAADLVTAALDALGAGRIVGLAGSDGCALVVDATSEAAVTRLRERTRCPHAPFSVIGRALPDLERLTVLDAGARGLVTSAARPIVLVPARLGTGLAPSVAPRLGDLGVGLAPSPLVQRLLDAGPACQVVTVGDPADADVVLAEDAEVGLGRAIVRNARVAIPIRRAASAEPIALPVSGPPVLAVGGATSGTVCLAAAGRAFLAPAGPDIAETVVHLRELAGVAPVAVAHDLHPDHATTRWALACGLPRIPVQQHHAHIAACLADRGRRDRVLGIAFDGGGLGDDGALWGGEVLDADLAVARRCGHLRRLALAGGEAAVREPWRLAVAALVDAGEPVDIVPRLRPLERSHLAGLLSTPLPVRGTSAARWFDAVAALLGIIREVSYPGQAAAELEAIAGTEIAPPLPFSLGGDPFEIDLRPAVRELAHEVRRGVPACVLASRFHATIAIVIRDVRRRIGRRTVALSGACFQNRRLVERTISLLEADDCEVLVHREVPAGDAGLALGQAAIATVRLAASR